MMSSNADLNYGSLNGEANVGLQQKKPSKTQKVLAVAKKPLRTVGKIVGKGRKSSSSHPMAVDEEVDEEGVEIDDVVGELMGHNGGLKDPDANDSSAGPGSNGGIPEVIGPQSHGSFMERVNSYRGTTGPVGAAASESGSTTTPRRGTLAGAFRVGGDAATVASESPFSTDQRDWVVFRLERYLRQLFMVLIAFIVGSFHAEWRVFVWKAMEYVGVAWVTCGILWLMAITSQPQATTASPPALRPRQLFNRRARGTVTPDAGNSMSGTTIAKEATSRSVETVLAKNGQTAGGAKSEEDAPSAVEPSGGTTASDDELAMLLPNAETEVKIKDPDENDSPKKKRAKKVIRKNESDGTVQEATIMPHPALNPYYVIDTTSGDRVIPNAKEPFVLSNEWFDMKMMILIRTPDVDDPSKPKGNEDNEAVCKYMSDKQRRFEFQYQLKLKKLPDGQKIYFSAELEEPVKMGIIQRAFVGAAMAFIKSTNNSFHYSMAGSKEDPDGRWEKPHMSFPVEMSMDRVVVTKPGETPPTLGEVISEDPESIKARKKGEPVDWNLEDTYTMALWTAYVDFLEWRVINLPGIRPFELNKVIGPQAILLTLYLIPKDRSAEKHYRRDITQVVELELCNTDTGLLGHHARKWAANSKQQPMIRSRSEDTVTEIEDEEEAEEDEEIDDEEDDDDDDDDDEDEEGQPEHSTAGELLGDETEYDAADAATAAELGEGMYLRSGDSVVLRESGVDEDDTPCFVTNGAGFAVLAEGVASASTIVMQKARRKNIRSRARNELIKSGDTVSIRLVTKKGRNREETEIRYLSIHRGWWLKWVSTPPKKNGFFTIFTHETEFSDHDPEELRTSETQSSYLTFGGSFWLRHKRWSQYSVGSAAEGSATYGGRVLGLFQPRSGTNPGAEITYNSDDEDLSLADGKGKKRWMKALQLRAYETTHASMASVPSLVKVGSEEQASDDNQGGDRPRLVFSNEDSRLDVPAWVEVMNRTERIRQLAYAVRVEPSSNNSSEESVSSDPHSLPFVRLRTGRDLAEIMRVGLSWRSTNPHPKKQQKPSTPISPQKPSTSGSTTDGYITPTKGGGSPSGALASSVNSRGLPNISSMDGSFDDLNGPEEGSQQWESDDDDETDGPSVIEYSELSSAGPTKKSKRRIVGSTIGAIGKVATVSAKVAKAGAKGSVKAGVAVTKAGVGVTKGGASMGKKVVVSSVKTSVKIGKGTVNAGVSAGKAIIGSTTRSKNPPGREPKSKAGQQAKWRRERDLHVAVNKTVKQIGPEQSNMFFLAGELSAPEQSYRTVSNVLARMSSIPTSSPFSNNFNNILSTQIVQASDQDNWFLSGGAMQVGVVPDSKMEVLKGALVCESLVARCLWESHWREEWCGVYRKSIVFYAPLTQKSCLELSFSDVQSIRLLDTHQGNPLPGFPILAIETAWQCHYLAFRNEESRENFREKVQILIPKPREVQITGASERELWKARFWQGFQNSVESDSAVGRGKWAEVQSGKKSLSRTILNGRRMDFDLDPEFLKEAGGIGKFVEGLLSTSLSFSLSSLERDPERLVKFLDAVSYLRLVPIVEIDRDGVEAFCLFVNLYHCLLQHALLLAVNGPLHRRTVTNFMRASCYEIGGDVFSLSEIQSCIIRGNMSRPISPKPPYVDVSKKSNAYRFYALKHTDPRVNFVMNTGDVSCPQDIPVLRPDRVEDQLSTASVAFLESQLSVDVIRRCVLLPKVCEVYKNDFEDEASGCLYFCSRYLDAATVNALKRMLREETTLTIKYQASADQYHTKLIMRKEKEETQTQQQQQQQQQQQPQSLQQQPQPAAY